MSNGKMRIKLAPIEIEYEGSEDFLKQELPDLLAAVSKLYQDSGLVTQAVNAKPEVTDSPKLHEPGAVRTQVSITTIAAKLAANSGHDLILAAAARLSRDGSTAMTRQALLNEMKLATGFYKSTYRANLSRYLIRLVKDGKLQETAKDTYTLSVSSKSEIEAKLVS